MAQVFFSIPPQSSPLFLSWSYLYSSTLELFSFFKVLLHWLFYVTAMPWYAVAKGRVNGVYATSELCNESIDDFEHPIFEEFPSQFLAIEWLQAGGLEHPPVFVSSPFPKFLGRHPRDMGRTATTYQAFLRSNQLEFPIVAKFSPESQWLQRIAGPWYCGYLAGIEAGRIFHAHAIHYSTSELIERGAEDQPSSSKRRHTSSFRVEV